MLTPTVPLQSNIHRGVPIVVGPAAGVAPENIPLQAWWCSGLTVEVSNSAFLRGGCAALFLLLPLGFAFAFPRSSVLVLTSWQIVHQLSWVVFYSDNAMSIGFFSLRMIFSLESNLRQTWKVNGMGPSCPAVLVPSSLVSQGHTKWHQEGRWTCRSLIDIRKMWLWRTREMTI